MSPQVRGQKRTFWSCLLPVVVALAFAVLAPPRTNASDEYTDEGSAQGAAGVEGTCLEQCKKKSEDANQESLDERPAQGASIFLGSAIDNFAASDVKKYLNPSASSDVQTFERLVGGLQFSWRLLRSEHQDQQLWLYGWTVHGVRSADVKCSDDDKKDPSSLCSDIDAGIDPTNRFLAIARNASSLEAAVGFRWEFLALGKEATGSARLFASVQESLLSVSGVRDDVLEQNHVGFGIVAPTGRLRESYVEVGYGRSELFSESGGRWKINGFVTWDVSRKLRVRGFARIGVDADFGPGSDSVQSYFGLRFDVCRLWSTTTDCDSSKPTHTDAKPDSAAEPGSGQ